jgi:hypothetical protein
MLEIAYGKKVNSLTYFTKNSRSSRDPVKLARIAENSLF